MKDILNWRKSTRSAEDWRTPGCCQNSECVEIAHLPGGGAAVRNSRDPGGAVLRFTAEEWAAFLNGAKNGEFDRFGSGQ